MHLTVRPNSPVKVSTGWTVAPSLVHLSLQVAAEGRRSSAKKKEGTSSASKLVRLHGGEASSALAADVRAQVRVKNTYLVPAMQRA